MFIRRFGVVRRTSLFAGVCMLVTFSVSAQTAAGPIHVDARYNAVAERHREERLRDERLWEERQLDARREQAIRNDYRQRAEHAQRAHALNEHEKPE
ncbi:MAG TPA: hypothetical protein VFE79_14160 [Paraburkholderia sp.]|jgi:hypothetical protein|nr:hypothetical protein [Paraburkholderia sp.]